MVEEEKVTTATYCLICLEVHSDCQNGYDAGCVKQQMNSSSKLKVATQLVSVLQVTAKVTLLRSVDWIKQQGAEVGNAIYLKMPQSAD